MLDLTLLPGSEWLAIAALAAFGLLAHATAWIRAARLRRRVAGLATRLEESTQRLSVAEMLLADTTGDASMLRQRVDQLTTRHETIASTTARNGFRQAIALSKHGATTRQLIDTCGLSQGEAHLIQTLYGRAAGPADQPAGEELH